MCFSRINCEKYIFRYDNPYKEGFCFVCMGSVDELVLSVREKGRMRPFTEGVYEYIKREHGNSVNCRIVPIKITEFQCGEFKPKFLESIRERGVFYIADPSLDPSKWLVDCILIGQASKLASGSELTYILSYMPWLRQDIKDKSRVPISARAVADILSFYGKRCVLCDPHFPQVQGYFSIPTDVLSAYPTVIEYLKENYLEVLKSQIITADGGGNKRIGGFAKRAGISLDVLTAEDIQLKRDPTRPNAVAKETVVHGEVKKPTGLVVEDMIDTGGTLLDLADGARKREKDGLKKLVVYATHFLNTNGALEKLRNKYDLILTTDTLPTPPQEKGKFEVVSMVPLFGEAIYRICVGQSVDSLFT